MRILHTSDWHLGRSFHGFSIEDHASQVLNSIVSLVREKQVDVVVIAGDIFDHASPAARYFAELQRVLTAIRESGAKIVLTSGNHDNATRLGFNAEYAALAGVHFVTAKSGFRTPIEITDEFGVVDFYGIPYLEPGQCFELYEGNHIASHESLLGAVTGEIRKLQRERKNRTVVLAHCFAANLGASQAASAADTEAQQEAGGLARDITAGGLDIVNASHFRGFTYTALGHLHGRITLADNIRYSGAPLYFSFGEVHRERGVWLVDLDASGMTNCTWHTLPTPRKMVRLRGTLAELLELPANEDWVEATLTDPVLPAEPMVKLRTKFKNCAKLLHDPPPNSHGKVGYRYSEKVAQRTPLEIADAFLEHVREGRKANSAESKLLRAAAKERYADQ